jgi:hypothetical protein
VSVTREQKAAARRQTETALEREHELERRKMLIQENAFALYEHFIEKVRR